MAKPPSQTFHQHSVLPKNNSRHDGGGGGGHGLGMVCGHIEAFGLFPFPHQGKICAEGLQGRHALSMLGKILQHNDVAISHSVA